MPPFRQEPTVHDASIATEEPKDSDRERWGVEGETKDESGADLGHSTENDASDCEHPNKDGVFDPETLEATRTAEQDRNDATDIDEASADESGADLGPSAENATEESNDSEPERQDIEEETEAMDALLMLDSSKIRENEPTLDML